MSRFTFKLYVAGLNLAPVNLKFPVERVVDDLSQDTAGRRVEFRVANLPRVTADPLLLRQVLVNLLSNALKFSRFQDAARIEVDTCQTPAGQAIVVRDNGIGFDMAYAAKLFGVFQRLHSEQQFEGTGIGLAIAQRIIVKHGGRMWAESAPGKGASFFFTFGELEAQPAGKDDLKPLRTSAGGRR